MAWGGLQNTAAFVKIFGVPNPDGSFLDGSAADKVNEIHYYETHHNSPSFPNGERGSQPKIGQ